MRTSKISLLLLLSLGFLIVACGGASNRVIESASWKTNFSKTYSHQLNVQYSKFAYKECKLDVYFTKQSYTGAYIFSRRSLGKRQ